ncbi:MAG: hypothetical protein WA948_07630 [Pontixanthobacter sp.]
MIVRKPLKIWAAAAAIIAAPSAMAQNDASMRPTAGQNELAQMLVGRIAEKPQECINVPRRTKITVIENTAVVYEVDSKLYVNFAQGLDILTDDATVNRQYRRSFQECEEYLVFAGGNFGEDKFQIKLGEFHPYRLPD